MSVELWFGSQPLLSVASATACARRPFLRLVHEGPGPVQLPLLPPSLLLVELQEGSPLPLLPDAPERTVLVRPGPPPPEASSPRLLLRRFEVFSPDDVSRLAAWFAPSSPLPPEEVPPQLLGDDLLLARFLRLLPFASTSDALSLAGLSPLPSQPRSALQLLQDAPLPRLSDLLGSASPAQVSSLLLFCLRRRLLSADVAADLFRLARVSPSSSLLLLRLSLTRADSSAAPS